jgi:hypothetical protein
MVSTFPYLFYLLKTSFYGPFLTDLDVIRSHQTGNRIRIVSQKFKSNSSFLWIKMIDGIFDQFIRKILKKAVLSSGVIAFRISETSSLPILLMVSS